MTPPFRIGVMQLTMEPLEEILEHARAMDEAGFDTIWLAEAYPWWRKHSMEARSSTAISPLVARETKRLAVGWGIISPYTRHPVQIAMEARVTQEAAGPGRFYLGLGASKIFMRHAGIGERAKPVGAIKDAVRICRGVLSGEAFDYEGGTFTAHVPALRSDAATPRWPVPVYVAGTGPQMLRAAGQVADGLLTASITTPAFVRYAREVAGEAAREAGRDPDAIDVGCTIVASIDENRDRGRDGAREIAGMYLANKVQNIQAAADTLLELAGLARDEIVPIAEAMERGGRLAAKAAVTDEILDKTVPIAGTPDDCVQAIEEYREAGCTHVMLELWGDDRLGQLRLFGEQVLPRVRR
jgi:5,10-methylenetetrahydromethanopterin reductase